MADAGPLGRALGARHHEAEDLAQTVLVKCYLAWSRVSAATHLDAYVMKILQSRKPID